MGHAFLCVLQFLLLNTLFHCGHTEDAALTLEPNWSTFFTGESVTFTCDMKEGEDAEWDYRLRKGGREIVSENRYTLSPLSTGNSGQYQCFGVNKRSNDTKTSNTIYVTVSAQRPKAKLTAGTSTIPVGGSVTLSCSVDVSDGWKYDWFRWQTHLPVTPTAGEDNSVIRVSEGGVYRCRGRRGQTPVYTHMSDHVTIEITYSNPVAVSLQLDWPQIFWAGITVRCEIQGGGGTQWEYGWKTTRSVTQWTQTNLWSVRVSESSSGGYMCQGRSRRDPYSSTQWSEAVTLTVSDAALTLEPNWSTFFTGESVTFTCDMKEGEDAEWDYRLSKGGREIVSENRYTLSPLSTGNSGQYQCFGVNKRSNHIKTSNTIYVTVSAVKPKAQLRADDRDIPVGGSVTLRCSVSPSPGWKYYWYRGNKSSKLLTSSDEQTRVSRAGLYWCRGGRGVPVYYTQYSDSVTVNKNVPNKVVVTLHPNWPQIFSGETITLRCEIKDRGDTEWEYEWKTPTSTTPSNRNEYKLTNVWASDSGDYRCKGRMKSEQQSSTEWSDAVTLTVSDNKVSAVLSVSPSWLSPGASVTLSCRVEPPSAGWTFYWYQAVPDLSHRSYRYELLPGADNGTELGSYSVHGQTYTAGHVCRAGRGEPEYSTDYSKPTFVWSGDAHRSASLTVSPDRVQHFTSDPVSLSCDGNSTEWRVRRFLPERGFPSSCSGWGKMTGPTCNIQRVESSAAVYWCESGSGLFSNAVNITAHNGDIILVSPVLPVTQGAPVTLGCRPRRTDVLSNVFFYKNDQLIQNGTRVELSISAASVSDQGFYRCEAKTQSQRNWGSSTLTSPQSWMSVKLVSVPEISSLPVSVIVGSVCGILLIIVLLLLNCYRKSKDSWVIRSKRTNQSADADHATNQDETQHNNCASPHDDMCLSELIKESEDTQENGESKNVTYAIIEFKTMVHKKKNNEPRERSIYSEVKVGSVADAVDNVVYAQVNSRNKLKIKESKALHTLSRPHEVATCMLYSSPEGVPTDETIYAEVKKEKANDE